MKYNFIKEQQAEYAITMLCRVMQVGTSAYYAWRQKGGQVIDSHVWRRCQRMKALFVESRQSLGSRQMMKQLRKDLLQVA